MPMVCLDQGLKLLLHSENHLERKNSIEEKKMAGKREKERDEKKAEPSAEADQA